MNFEFTNMPVMVAGRMDERMIIPPRFQAGSPETLSALLSEGETLVLALCTMSKWCGVAHLGRTEFGYGSASILDALEQLFRGRSCFLRTTDAGILVFGKEENLAAEVSSEWLKKRGVQFGTRFVRGAVGSQNVQVRLDPSQKKASVFGMEIPSQQKCAIRMR